MSAERRLRLVHPDEVAPEPADPEVWRRGLSAARAALAGGRHQRPEDPAGGPDGTSAGSAPASFRPRLPSVEAAWAVFEGHQGEAER